jgi:ATP-binding cassette subfamily B protein
VYNEGRLDIIRAWSMNFPAMTLLVAISTAFILWFGGRMVIAGDLTVGTLVAFNTYLVMLAFPAQRLGFVVDRVSQALASSQRVFAILDTPSEVTDAPDAVELGPIEGYVAFEDVSFAYRESRPDPSNPGGLQATGDYGPPVLSGVTFKTQPNQIIALMGLTGSGKSSIINLIPRFYDPTAGRVTIDGHDLRDAQLESLRRQIGLVLQDSFLFSATIRENIAYGRPDATDEEIIAAAAAADAHSFISTLPDGYETEVGERGLTLSGGQRQRLSIARALLMNPRILILDDATSSVDPATEYEIQQALARLMQGRNTFVIAQRLLTLKNADQILVLDQGRSVQQGRHEELLQQPGLYRQIYDLQLRDQEETANAGARRVVPNAPELAAGYGPRGRK